MPASGDTKELRALSLLATIGWVLVAVYDSATGNYDGLTRDLAGLAGTGLLPAGWLWVIKFVLKRGVGDSPEPADPKIGHSKR